VAFCDDDCTPPDDWTEELLAAWRDHPDAVVLGGTVSVDHPDSFTRRYLVYRNPLQPAEIALAHRPSVLVLDEPLNGLDPMARSETIALFRQWGEEGRHVIVSSHILHEVDRISDQVILLSHGYVVAEGQIQGVRSEVKDQPMQILVRCDKPGLLASRLFEQDHVVEAKVNEDGRGLLVRTRDADSLYLLLNRIVLDNGLEVEAVAPADDDVNSVYQYLIGAEGGTT